MRFQIKDRNCDTDVYVKLAISKSFVIISFISIGFHIFYDKSEKYWVLRFAVYLLNKVVTDHIAIKLQYVAAH